VLKRAAGLSAVAPPAVETGPKVVTLLKR
jgi:hypothetical protein